MSAHFAPLIFLCRMAVYAAALIVLATARLPDSSAAEVAVAPTAALSRRAAEPPSRLSPSAIRAALAMVIVLGVLADGRRPSWR